MFSSRFNQPPPSSKMSFTKSHRASKSSSSFSKESGISKRRHDSHRESRRRPTTATTTTTTGDESPNLTSAIVTLVVGEEQRIFAAHEHVLSHSAYFEAALRDQFMDASSKRICIPDEEPEIFSSVLEYLYKGDYYPRLVHNKRKNSWELEPTTEDGRAESTVLHCGPEGDLLKDTVIYCAAHRYGLDELKRVALRKQGLQSGIQCSTILASARYAYANTPDTDSKLRAHYLALIIRSRSTFKKSGTMQMEMYNGGTPLFFDLFVALCNHVDDVSTAQTTPRSNRHFF
ncbi:hypothetical protein PspLS_01362 [Pyricularia sp. CBS 133598]|nr:hypothetical protein PspLS_01362 [Pyricularia sp. CBS 133598]